MNTQEAKRVLETALLCAQGPLTLRDMRSLFADELNADSVRSLLDELLRDWEGRGVELVALASGWRFQSRPELREHLDRLNPEKPPRYSRAVLETLAIIAYRQPVTRGDIEDIRGVVVATPIIKQLEDRNWIEVIGHREAPGRPALYATTRQFLDDLGLSSLEQLPALIQGGDPTPIAGALQGSLLEELPAEIREAEDIVTDGVPFGGAPEASETPVGGDGAVAASGEVVPSGAPGAEANVVNAAGAADVVDAAKAAAEPDAGAGVGAGASADVAAPEVPAMDGELTAAGQASPVPESETTELKDDVPALPSEHEGSNGVAAVLQVGGGDEGVEALAHADELPVDESRGDALVDAGNATAELSTGEEIPTQAETSAQVDVEPQAIEKPRSGADSASTNEQQVGVVNPESPQSAP
ncbi:SMC-Scp complex subunit ScpB [Roseateles amylovorans]|uniref:SMC-Scp complex subunit ScpB n=1 Tax=Roseateles amylovorans TaxID=2978473 RepID=A0ABY6AWL4_9BURK|nr:SMC-Scp complex subunit ScpB [Roseateles amylovorans]UXH77072.1 SMC-Scp complex subunit ScpB [Roseateles amylovorans]